MSTSSSPLSLEMVAQLQAILKQIAHGEAPFGPPPTGIVRRAHTIDIPTLVLAEGEEPLPPAWPELPLAAGRFLTSAQVGRAVLATVSDEAIAGTGSDVGLTFARLRTALQNAGFDPSNVGRAAPALSLWLARAGVLAAPDDEARPWASARPLRLTDTNEIREALQASGPPAPESVTAERDRGLR